jgi:hypothetical protein
MKASARPKKLIKSKSRTVLSMSRPLSCFAARDFKPRQPKSISIPEESSGHKSGIDDV